MGGASYLNAKDSLDMDSNYKKGILIQQAHSERNSSVYGCTDENGNVAEANAKQFCIPKSDKELIDLEKDLNNSFGVESFRELMKNNKKIDFKKLSPESLGVRG